MELPIKFRVSVVGLFIDANDVLLIHQTTPPDPDCWDLPGGGLQPGETLMAGLAREVLEETGVTDFQVKGLLTIVEKFFPQTNQLLHTLSIVYQCSVKQRPATLYSDDPEIGDRGIQWMAIANLTPQVCSPRTWEALQAEGLVD
jgi:8-oxo-dGTP diphosphatase